MTTMQIDIQEAKAKLPQLVDAARRGKTIVIAKAGTPMAKLVPLEHDPKPTIRFGLMKGQIEISDDFDATLPSDLSARFEGREGGDAA
jgi:prevent-host-death family protein